MFRFIPIVIIATLLSVCLAIPGCSLLGQPVAEKVAEAVEKYCAEPYQARQLYRYTVNGELAAAGHSVTVHCAGDPEPQTQLLEGDAWSHIELHAARPAGRKPEG